MIAEREEAWAELHAATASGWWVGQPSYHNERRVWLLYAFDPSERAVVGTRQRERSGDRGARGRRRARGGAVSA